MATRTEILGLVKPGLEDDADIRVINANMDILDKQIGEVNSVQKHKASWFDSVADMKAEHSLTAGAYVCTAGYYTPNDGGGASYLIRAKADTDTDDGGSVHTLQNNLVAELIIENGTVNVKQFGASGDGVTDDTIAIRNAIHNSYHLEKDTKWRRVFHHKIFIPNGTYKITDTLYDTGIEQDTRNLNILGAGCRSTHIFTETTNDILIISLAHDVYINGIEFINNSKNEDGGITKVNKCFVLGYAGIYPNKVIIEHTRILLFDYGIYTITGWDYDFNDLYVYECNTGLSIAGTGTLLRNTEVGACTLAVEYRGGSNIVNIHNTFESNVNGITIEGTYNITFNGLYVESNSESDIVAGKTTEVGCIEIQGLVSNFTHPLYFGKVQTLIIHMNALQRAFNVGGLNITKDVINPILIGADGVRYGDRRYQGYSISDVSRVNRPYFSWNPADSFFTSDRMYGNKRSTVRIYGPNASIDGFEKYTENGKTVIKKTLDISKSVTFNFAGSMFDISKKYTFVYTYKYAGRYKQNVIYAIYKDNTGETQTVELNGTSAYYFSSDVEKTDEILIDFPNKLQGLDVAKLIRVQVQISNDLQNESSLEFEFSRFDIYLGDNITDVLKLDNKNRFTSFEYNAQYLEASTSLTIGNANISRSNEPSMWAGNIGDIIYNTNPVSGGFIGWVCVDIASDGARTWKAFGQIA